MRKTSVVLSLCLLGYVVGDAYCPPCPFADVDENQACKEVIRKYVYQSIISENEKDGNLCTRSSFPWEKNKQPPNSY